MRDGEPMDGRVQTTAVKKGIAIPGLCRRTRNQGAAARAATVCEFDPANRQIPKQGSIPTSSEQKRQTK
jgi:hypothetical protein